VRGVDDPGGMLDALIDRDVGEVKLLEFRLGSLAAASGGSTEVALQPC